MPPQLLGEPGQRGAVLLQLALRDEVPAPAANGEGGPTPTAVVDGNVLEDAYQALLSVGHNPAEARDRLDKVLTGGRTYKSVDEILMEIYKQGV